MSRPSLSDTWRAGALVGGPLLPLVLSLLGLAPDRRLLPVVLGALVSLCAWLHEHAPRCAHALFVAAVAAGGALASPALHGRPATALALILAAAATISLDPRRASRAPRHACHTAAALAGIAWLLLQTAPHGDLPALAHGAAAASMTLAALTATTLTRGRLPLLQTGPLCLAVTALASMAPASALGLGPAALALGLARWARRRDELLQPSPFWGVVLAVPARLLVVTFALVAVVGTSLLALPGASSSGDTVGLIDAAFTAFSATCVTGLVTLDTGADFSGTGQLVILGLIQVGGLGVMTFSAAGLILIGRRLSLRQEGTLLELLGSDDRSALAVAIRRVLWVTFSVEALGALTLALLFHSGGDAWGQALWHGVFTSVSAFCNAGFALQPDSLVRYQLRPAVLHTVGTLIMLGGLGPAVVVALPALARRRSIPLHARIALGTSALLWIVPAAFIALAERNNALAPLGAWDALHNAWFQSVTLRTAGFNSIDLQALHPATHSLMLLLMFVGGCTGSTAGGIKTSTVAVLALGVVSALRGQSHLEALGVRLAPGVLLRALAVLILGLLSVVVAVLALQLTQTSAPDALTFEAISALGTVGLSTGATGELDRVGKVLIIACMFVGRVGPLSVVLFFVHRRSETRWGRPEREIPVG